jgi:hypothetical protein
MNPVVAVTTAQEFVQPAVTQDGGFAVAFFNRDMKMEFCIPVDSEEEAVALAIRFQTMMCQVIERYQKLGGT